VRLAWLSIPFFWSQYTAAEVFEGARPGPPLAELAARIPPTPILFIASTWAIERKAALLYARAAGERGDLWEVDAGHTQGLRDHPQEYARRVIGFFNRTLRPSSQ
jgi:hypothetical protein